MLNGAPEPSSAASPYSLEHIDSYVDNAAELPTCVQRIYVMRYLVELEEFYGKRKAVDYPKLLVCTEDAGIYTMGNLVHRFEPELTPQGAGKIASHLQVMDHVKDFEIDEWIDELRSEIQRQADWRTPTLEALRQWASDSPGTPKRMTAFRTHPDLPIGLVGEQPLYISAAYTVEDSNVDSLVFVDHYDLVRDVIELDPYHDPLTSALKLRRFLFNNVYPEGPPEDIPGYPDPNVPMPTLDWQGWDDATSFAFENSSVPYRKHTPFYLSPVAVQSNVHDVDKPIFVGIGASREQAASHAGLGLSFEWAKRSDYRYLFPREGFPRGGWDCSRRPNRPR